MSTARDHSGRLQAEHRDRLGHGSAEPAFTARRSPAARKTHAPFQGLARKIVERGGLDLVRADRHAALPIGAIICAPYTRDRRSQRHSTLSAETTTRGALPRGT